ncbi:MAG: DUF4056 domain-containing protein [Candidatus Binatia bacterium]
MSNKWTPGALAFGVLAVTIVLAGCVYAPRWQAQKEVSPDLVAQALDKPGVMSQELRPEDVPAFPVRVHLRPCCAFGTHLRASLGRIPVPVFSIGNITSVDRLGPHRYDSGAFSLEGSSAKNAFSSERNGLVYTCRGGFIDTAHVRDYADWTVFWAATIARLSESGGTVELPPEGGKRRVIIQPLPARLLDRYGLRRTAIALAQWLAFHLSVWHEIATAYGFASIDIYPEYVSAFSPEDLYSNLLGIKIAGGLIMQSGNTATDSLYDQSMDRWLQATLLYLRSVPVGAGTNAMYLVDGVWWNSRARLPDPRLVAHRNLDAGLTLTPWQISRAYSSPDITAWADEECGGSERPLLLRRVDSANGIRFADLVTLAIDVDVKDPFPFPRAGSTEITQADFPAIIEAVRQKVFRALGAGSDRPERDAP